ncbi:MAG TPA: hypothetical protein VG860_16610 [Terriglobia bacterium]|jgi:hypothetical protein|nr:hypothetical protein [Terriglobia bacterium]
MEALKRESAPEEPEAEIGEVSRGEPMVIIGIAFCSALMLLVGICIGWWLRGK